ncbi:MAG TPA: SpoIIE family protein phosphatase, partial [Thermoleophilaceae bacterium]|nr:SpoIIE family protein phosphatase [Thermoleophilaceae bacterium]
AELGREALAGADLGELGRSAVEMIAVELGVPVAVLVSPGPDGQSLVFRAQVGLPRAPQVLNKLPPDDPGQLTYTLREGAAVVSPDLSVESRFTPSPVMVEQGVRSAASVPVGVQGGPFGVLAAGSRRADDFSDDDVNFLQGMATTLAAAVDRERAAAEREQERLRLEEALRLASANEARFRELADTAPVFIWTSDADGMIDFINRGWLDYTGRNLEDELGDSWDLGVHPDDKEGVTDSWWRAFRRKVPWEREYRLLGRDGDYRWIVDRGVPRFDGDRLVGYVGTATDIHQRKEIERKLNEAYQRDHEVAETLQRSLLPESLPKIEGLQLDARYLPASRSAAIGGDWYDAVELDDGRVAVVVGDVVGHGLRAAVVMGQLRTAFRAYALLGTSPADTLARLNRLLMKEGGDLMATALYMLLDRDTGQVWFASAGHPPALVVSRDSEPRYLEGGRSVPLGTSDIAYQEAETWIERGSTLLLYTDGLVERRDTSLDDRLAQLATVAGIAGGELGDVCDQILGGLLGGQRPSDDVALLALRPEPPTAGSLELRLPADPVALAQLRQRIGRFLDASGANDEERFELTLAVSEAAMNAIEHAYGPSEAEFDLSASISDGEFQAEIRDSGRWRERRSDDRGRGLAIIEALMDDVEVTAAPTGTSVRMRRRMGQRSDA